MVQAFLHIADEFLVGHFVALLVLRHKPFRPLVVGVCLRELLAQFGLSKLDCFLFQLGKGHLLDFLELVCCLIDLCLGSTGLQFLGQRLRHDGICSHGKLRQERLLSLNRESH